MVRKRKTKKVDKPQTCCSNFKCGSGGCAYFVGFLGAAIYYIQTATGFWSGVFGVVKAIVWPAFLVHHLFGL